MLATSTPAASISLPRSTPGCVRNADGTANYYVAQVQDLTDAPEAEQQLIEAQKVQTVGRLAAGIAHDFNNLLQAMLLQIQLLGSGVLGAEAATAATAEIEDQVHRGKSLVRQLLLFARRDTARPEQLDLNELVASASRMLGRLVPSNIAFSQQLESEPLYVDGDRNQLEQVLVNLVVNAAHAMQKGGTLVIRTGREDEDSIFLSVQDTGHGIPEEIRDKIFEPFFTTKPAEIGTGLGLSVVHAIVARHSGHLDLVTEVGHGTTFKIGLPAVRSPRVAAAATEKPIVTPLLVPAQSTGERILVVEDEAGARAALRQILQALGYSVTVTASAEEAALVSATTPPQASDRPDAARDPRRRTGGDPEAPLAGAANHLDVRLPARRSDAPGCRVRQDQVSPEAVRPRHTRRRGPRSAHRRRITRANPPHGVIARLEAMAWLGPPGRPVSAPARTHRHRGRRDSLPLGRARPDEGALCRRRGRPGRDRRSQQVDQQ